VSKPYIKSGTIRTEGPYSRSSTGKGTIYHGGGLLLVIITLFVLALPASGQRKSDIGIMAAVPWYLGDISYSMPQPVLFPPAFGPIFRYNFNMRNSLRAHAVFYELAGSGEILGGTEAEFQSSFVDLGLDFEFNWWAYQTALRRTKYSPYVTAGLGYGIDLGGGSVSHLYIPFGGGVKVNLGKRLSSGIEVTMRKTFTDMLDGVPNAGGDEVQTFVGNNDWYMFTGVFLTYKVFNYLNDCPAFPDKSYRMNSQSRNNKSATWFEKPHEKKETIFKRIGAVSKSGKRK
jgi:hypothetical protein